MDKRKRRTEGDLIVQGLEEVLEHVETGKPFPVETKIFRIGNSRIIKTRKDGRTVKVEKIPEEEWQKRIEATKKELGALKKRKCGERQEVDVEAIRERLGLTQKQFSSRFQIPIGTLCNWEQRRRIPRGTARNLLIVIEHNAEAVQHALSS